MSARLIHPRLPESRLRGVSRTSALVLGIAFSALSVIEAGAQGVSADNKPARNDAAARLFEQHCRKCHSGEKHKGDFQIEGLSRDFADTGNRAMWSAVMEQLEAGDMPPKKEPQPAAKELRAAVDWIRERAESAEIARRASEGRVVLRRLNREEYVNTIRDLLHVEVDLSDLLPPDTSTSGFDNNAEALHTSSFLLRNYLVAADRSLDEAIANTGKPWQINERFDLRKEKSVRPIGSVYRHVDDGVAIFAVWESANIRVTMWNMFTRFRGKYRIRISGYGYQSEGKPVDFHVNAGTFKEVTEERLIDYYSFPADKPTVLEFTEQLEPQNRLRIIADGLPALPPQVEKVGADKYKGPGLAIQWVEVVGPLLESWPPPSHKSIFDDLRRERVPSADDPKRLEVVSRQPVVDAEWILRSFARRAFRRSVTDEDIRPFLARTKSRLKEGYSFEQAVRVGLKGIMVSPNFLFLREKANAGDAAGLSTPTGLSDDALASRLSYFLWSSMPDEELLQLAEARKLREPGILRQQVERMLNDPKAGAFTENFTGQWLSLRAIDATAPDRTLYPEYDDVLKDASLKEPKLFFNEMLKRDLSLTNFVSSDFTFLNARLAKHYGIPGVEGAHMRKVALQSGTHRGGVMTMASVLKVTANGTTTSPVLRGAWLLERILGTPPPKPPPDIEAIEPDIRGATTIRNQLAKHREVESCARCHKEIDPPGFALESFDVIGGWRDRYRAMGSRRNSNGRWVRYTHGPAVDPSDVLPDGRRFANIDEYKGLLLEDKDQLARNLVKKLLAYSTGAPPGPVDKPEIETIVGRVRDKNYGFRSLVHEIVQSEMFHSK
ncbi:MAG: mono/diheme cytochrome c family protein [Candidatus Binatia bacterium]|jgi:mono/diheme cytochrome c family protein